MGLITADIVDLATLLGVFLSYLSLNIGLSDSKGKRQNSIYQAFVLGEASLPGGYSVVGADIKERETYLYSLSKLLNPFRHFSGSAMISIQSKSDLPSEHQIKQTFSPHNSIMNDISVVDKRNLQLNLDSTRTSELGPMISDSIEQIDLVRTESAHSTVLSEGQLSPLIVEYYPSKFQLIEHIASKIRRHSTHNSPVRGGLLSNHVSYWRHCPSISHSTFGILPRIEIARNSPNSFQHLSGDEQTENGDFFSTLKSESSGINATNLEIERLHQEFSQVYLTPVIEESGKVILVWDQKRSNDTKFRLPTNWNPDSESEYFPLSIIAFKGEMVRGYYQIEKDSFRIREWNKEADSFSQYSGKVNPASLELDYFGNEELQEQREPLKSDMNPNLDYFKPVWISDRYESILKPAGTIKQPETNPFD